VRLVATARGGHAGWVAARGRDPSYWGEERAVAFLKDPPR
jgi:predicted alpha/beta-fold hydrolase